MYDKLVKFMTGIGIDKYMHFSLAVLISWVIKTCLTIATPLSWWIVSSISFGVVLVLAISKEVIYDKWCKKGTPEWKDLWIGLFGALLGSI